MIGYQTQIDELAFAEQSQATAIKVIGYPFPSTWEKLARLADLGVTIILRPWVANQALDNPQQRAQALAQEVIGKVPSKRPSRLYVEGYNEMLGADYGEWTAYYAEALARAGLRHIAYNFSTGSPYASDWPRYLEGLRVTQRYGGGLGLHEYWKAAPGESDTVGHRQVVSVLPSDLKQIPIWVTEAGVDRALITASGWRSILSPAQYAAQLVSYGQLLAASRAQGVNLQGATLFGAGMTAMWSSFELLGQGQDVTGAALRQVNGRYIKPYSLGGGERSGNWVLAGLLGAAILVSL